MRYPWSYNIDRGDDGVSIRKYRWDDEMGEEVSTTHYFTDWEDARTFLNDEFDS